MTPSHPQASRTRTQAQGTTSTNNLIDVVDFFRTTVLPDLQGDNVNTLPVLRADAIKYIINFRLQVGTLRNTTGPKSPS